MEKHAKCTVIGCGNVGATIAYALTGTSLFTELCLLDIDRKRARGEAMDISHGLPFLSPMQVYAGDYADTDGSDVVVIAAGANQKPGESRRDLLSRNMAIFDRILEQLVPHCPDAVYLVVTNPVDLLTYHTLKVTGLSPARVIGSGTVLDTARLKQLVGEQFSVDSRNVHTFILGEHGDSEVPIFSSANISGINLLDYCRLCGGRCDRQVLEKLFLSVRDAAYQIIEGKGATYYAIAQAVRRILSAIVRDEHSILPVSTLADGHFGLHDVCLGIPAIVGRNGVESVLDIPLDAAEQKALAHSAALLRSEWENAKNAGVCS